MARRRILLTGANGFVGRQVLANLPADAEVFATSRSEQGRRNWLAVDLRNEADCRALIGQVRPDLLIHTAWNTEHGAFWEAEDNEVWLEASKALFSAFVQSGGERIVGCGSCAEYAGASLEPRREGETGHSAAPGTRYGRAKLALYHHLARHGVSHAWARIFLTYGAGEDTRRLVPSIARALLSGEPAKSSSGMQLRDFLEVRDLGRALAQLSGSAVQGAINLGHGQFDRIAEVVRIMGELASREELVMIGALPDRPGEAPVLVPDLTRQREELGFTPEIDLRTGLSNALAWWETNG